MNRKAVVLIVAFSLFVWIGHGNSIAEVITKIYWTDWGTGSIQRANLDGTEREDIATGFAGVRGITVDNSNGKMYWIDNRTGSIQRGNLDGTDRENIITGLESPSGVELDVSNGKLYWSDAGTGSIQRSNLDGTGIEDIITGLESPSGVALDGSGGKLYWSDVRRGSIQRSNLDGTRIEDIITGLESPSGVALDMSNGKMYWADILGGKIQRANLDGTRIEDIATDLESPLDVTLDVSNGKMYWADFGTGKIQRGNLDGTRIEDIATDLLSPTGVALSVSETSIPQPDLVIEITNTRQPDLVIVEYRLTGGFQRFNLINEATLPPSQNFTLGLGVENQGKTQAASSTLRYYLSNDNIISSSDREVRTQTVPALSANLFSYETAILTAPTAPGIYYYGMCVDPVPNESNTDNNCSTAIRITVEAPVVQTTVSVPIYWTDWGTGSIQRVNLDGAEVQDIATGLDSPSGVALDIANRKMYWITDTGNTGTGKIQRANLDGTNAQDLVTGLSSPGVIALDVAGGKMYWTDSGKIQRANLDGSGIENFVTGLSDPQGIALDVAGGKMYWTDRDTHKIQRANLDGSGIEDLVTGLSFPSDIALDVAGGKMYWANWAWLSPKIQRANLNGSNVQDLITSEGVVSSPNNIALDIENGKIYWTVEQTGIIQRANLDGSNVEDIVTGLGIPNSIVLDVTGGSQEPPVEPRDDPSEHKIYWTDGNKIQRANLDGTNVKDLITGFPWPLRLALDISGGKMYWTNSGTLKIQRANLDGTNIEDLVTRADGLRVPGGIALDVSGGKMYWTDRDGYAPAGYTSKIQRANLDGTNIEDLITTGLREPYGLALDISGGKMYWADYTAHRIRCANLDGTQVETLVTGLSSPPDIALDVVGGKMYWTNRYGGKIQCANLDGTQVETLVTGLSGLQGIALDVSSGKMYWTDSDTDKIQRANLDGTQVEDLVTGLTIPQGLALDVAGDSHEPVVEPRNTDVNGDGVVDLDDTTVVRENLGQTGENEADVNGDGVVDVEDLVLVLAAIEAAGGAPALKINVSHLFTAEEVQQWFIEVRTLAHKSPAHRRGILMLEQLLALLTPKKTSLLPNYPNPFNPETWIPYQLAKDTDVTLHIYTVNGTLVRTLALGHKAAGMYQNRSRAAYWDGKNEVGESVASGVYFYRFTGGGFSATRKMLIMK